VGATAGSLAGCVRGSALVVVAAAIAVLHCGLATARGLPVLSAATSQRASFQCAGSAYSSTLMSRTWFATFLLGFLSYGK